MSRKRCTKESFKNLFGIFSCFNHLKHSGCFLLQNTCPSVKWDHMGHSSLCNTIIEPRVTVTLSPVHWSSALEPLLMLYHSFLHSHFHSALTQQVSRHSWFLHHGPADLYTHFCHHAHPFCAAGWTASVNGCVLYLPKHKHWSES